MKEFDGCLSLLGFFFPSRLANDELPLEMGQKLDVLLLLELLHDL